MEQTQTFSGNLEAVLDMTTEEVSGLLREHSLDEIDNRVREAQKLKKYADILMVKVKDIQDDSQETLDAKASVSLQKVGDGYLAFGMGCTALAYGSGKLIEQFTTIEADVDLGLALAAGSAALWGTLGVIGSITHNYKAWKHYNQTSPELQEEIGRPWPLKQYAKAGAYVTVSTGKAVYQATKESIRLHVSAAKGLCKGVNKAIQYVCSKFKK